MRVSLIKLSYEVFGLLCEETWVINLWKCIYTSSIEINDDMDDSELMIEVDITISINFEVAVYNKGLSSRAE